MSLQTERGRIEAEESIRGNELLPQVNPDEYPMIGHIDLYGNTIFNRQQMVTLLSEVERLKKESFITQTQQESLELVERMCRMGTRKVHRYLWFLGD
ncbi:hypothetical protein [Nocardiopsis rhodophaea]|uniref:hypothetical protein n=1 Tax=Nocardiopsis rhodophaea TaxID=280238 RepID=UPI0031CE7830